MISARALGYRVGSRDLVQDLDLRVRAGELCVMVGANGAGKSTTLKLLSGELPMTQGEVLLNDRPLTDWAPTERARCLTVLPQASHLSFGLKVSEVVALGRLPFEADCTRGESTAIVEEAMCLTDVHHLRDRSYLTLSGGERHRTHLARTLAQLKGAGEGQSRVLLLDEPIASLDLRHQFRVMELVKGLAASGVAVLAVLHDLNMAVRFADRVMVLHDGSCLVEGEPSEVFTPALFSKAFGLNAELVELSGGGGRGVLVRGHLDAQGSPEGQERGSV